MNPYAGCFVEMYRGRYYVFYPDNSRIAVGYKKRADADAYLVRLIELGRSA